MLITTGKSGGCSDVQVLWQVFGEKGDTGAMPLGEPRAGLFQAGNTDQFDVSCRHFNNKRATAILQCRRKLVDQPTYFDHSEKGIDGGNATSTNGRDDFMLFLGIFRSK